MTPPTDAIETVGEGPDLLLIHGTAADKGSFGALVRALRRHLRVTSYDRRGTAVWQLPADADPPSLEEHAADSADVLLDRAAGSAFVCGVSFGGLVALELIRRRPELVRGAALFEPPIARNDEVAGKASPFTLEFDRLVRAGKGEDASERFQRRLLSDALWERLPASVQREKRSQWRPIHADLMASAAHRPRYDELARIEVPVLLLRGADSGPALEPSLRALAAALPRSRRVSLQAAAHGLGGQAWRQLADVLIELCTVD